MAALCAAAADVTVDNIRYTLRKSNTLSCAAANKSALVDVRIPETVRLGGIDYYVTEIEAKGFSKCPNLQTIDIPNSVKKIGINAFYNCKELHTVVMPDNAEVKVYEGNYGYGKQGIFKGCVKLANVSGHDIPYPRYVIYDAFYNCEDTPFYTTILTEGSAELASREFPKEESAPTIVYVTGQEQTFTPKAFTPDTIDLNIPATTAVNERTFAMIIGNENYKRVAPVDFAANDARVFGQYCERTLGLPKNNIRTYPDATYGDFVSAINDLRNISAVYDGKIKVIVYYAGHGIPDESSRDAYLLPVDASGTDVSACYPLSKFYDELSSLNAEQVVAFIDACFSGSQRGNGMLANARGVRLRPRDIAAKGNLIVISAASADQPALPYEEKGHGIFTYYLLRKLNETSGNIALGDLTDYLSSEVARQSVVVNHKLQLPMINFAPGLHSTWRTLRLK